jgi:hypothetical protein
MTAACWRASPRGGSPTVRGEGDTGRRFAAAEAGARRGSGGASGRGGGSRGGTGRKAAAQMEIDEDGRGAREVEDTDGGRVLNRKRAGEGKGTCSGVAECKIAMEPAGPDGLRTCGGRAGLERRGLVLLGGVGGLRLGHLGLAGWLPSPFFYLIKCFSVYFSGCF